MLAVLLAGPGVFFPWLRRLPKVTSTPSFPRSNWLNLSVGLWALQELLLLQPGPHQGHSLGCEPLVPSRQSWHHGHVTRVASYGSMLRKAPAWFRALLPQS